jgi:hypothetical protein
MGTETPERQGMSQSLLRVGVQLFEQPGERSIPHKAEIVAEFLEF